MNEEYGIYEPGNKTWNWLDLDLCDIGNTKERTEESSGTVHTRCEEMRASGCLTLHRILADPLPMSINFLRKVEAFSCGRLRGRKPHFDLGRRNLSNAFTVTFSSSCPQS